MGLHYCVQAISICGKWALLPHCGVCASHAGASLVGQHRLWSVQASVVVAQWLGCPVAYGFFLDQRLNPCPLHLQVDS